MAAAQSTAHSHRAQNWARVSLCHRKLRALSHQSDWTTCFHINFENTRTSDSKVTDTEFQKENIVKHEEKLLKAWPTYQVDRPLLAGFGSLSNKKKGYSVRCRAADSRGAQLTRVGNSTVETVRCLPAQGVIRALPGWFRYVGVTLRCVSCLQWFRERGGHVINFLCRVMQALFYETFTINFLFLFWTFSFNVFFFVFVSFLQCRRYNMGWIWVFWDTYVSKGLFPVLTKFKCKRLRCHQKRWGTCQTQAVAGKKLSGFL